MAVDNARPLYQHLPSGFMLTSLSLLLPSSISTKTRTHRHTHTGATTRLPCECFTFCSKQSLAQNLIKQRLCGASSHRNKLHFHLMCAYLICKHKTHISTQRRVKPHFKTETKLHFIFQVGCAGYAVDERGL